MLTEIQATLVEVKKENKSLAKLVRKLRASQDDPDGEKAKARAKNNGFNIPRKITPEFRKFLNIGEDELITRSQVNKKISEYVNANNLKHPENGRIILIDDALRSLLEPPEDVQITYLNIQKYLSRHYIKDEVSAPVQDDQIVSIASEPKEPREPKEPKMKPKLKPVVKKA